MSEEIETPQSAAQTIDDTVDNNKEERWFVLRDLKRSNAKNPAYKDLAGKGFEVFTPLQWKEVLVKGRRKRVQVPAVAGLLFVHSEHDTLQQEIDVVDTLQFRYVRGGYRKPMIVGDAEMNNFIKAVSGTDTLEYHTIEETAKMSIGKKVRIIGGPLDDVVGQIVSIRGSKKKRLIVSIPGFIAALIEVSTGEIQILD